MENDKASQSTGMDVEDVDEKDFAVGEDESKLAWEEAIRAVPEEEGHDTATVARDRATKYQELLQAKLFTKLKDKFVSDKKRKGMSPAGDGGPPVVVAHPVGSARKSGSDGEGG